MSTHNIPFSMLKKKITLIYPKSIVMGFCSNGLKNEFETAVVNEPSVFEPLKFYCIVLGNRHADQTFRTTAEAEGEVVLLFYVHGKHLSGGRGLDLVKLI